jgi:hypothetical protein
LAIDYVTLGHIAYARISTPRHLVEYSNDSTNWLLQSKKQTEERCFACPVRANNSDKLATIETEAGVSPNNFVRITCDQVLRSDDFWFD